MSRLRGTRSMMPAGGSPGGGAPDDRRDQWFPVEIDGGDATAGYTGFEVWLDSSTPPAAVEVVGGRVLTAAQPGFALDGTEFAAGDLALARLGPGAGGRLWELTAFGGGGGDCCPASEGGGLASLLSLSKGACVEVVGFGGVGRCENLAAFDAIVAKWSPGDAAWVTAADDAVTTPLGDTVFHYWVASEVPRLKAVGEDGEVEFKFNGSDGTYLWFITRSPLLCTDPPGGPCVPNVWTVRIRCVECSESVSCAPQAVCVVPPDCMAGPFDLCTLFGTIGAEGFVIDTWLVGGDCPWDSSFSNWEITAPCVEGVVDFSQTALSWTTSPGGLSGVIYPDVQVVSVVPLHLRVFVDFGGTSHTTCGDAGEVTFEVWPAHANGSAEDCGPPTDPVDDCEECAGGAPYAWMADLSALPTADYFGDLDAWNHGGTVEAGSAGYWWNNGGSCVWVGWNAGEGAYAATTVTVGATDITLDLDGVIYSAAKGADCCGPYTLALGDIGTFPGDPGTLPETLTLVAYGECASSPPPPPTACCDGEGGALAAHPDLELVVPDGTNSGTYALAWDTDRWESEVFAGPGDSNRHWQLACADGVWTLGLYIEAVLSADDTDESATCDPLAMSFPGATFGGASAITVSVA